MKKFWLACTMVIAVGISSCVDSEKDLYQEGPEKESNTNDFSTEKIVQVDINYSLAKAKVPFLIYDENPISAIKDANGNLTSACKFNDNIAPLDGAWTDDEGKFSGKITLPSYVSKVYIVSKAFYATRLIEGKVVNGVLKVSEPEYKEQPETRAFGNNAIKKDPNRFKKLGWSTLGDFDPHTGQIKYAYTGTDPQLTFTKKEREQFSQTIYSVLNTVSKCPEAYRKSNDLYITGDTKGSLTDVVLTSLGGWTCWNSSLGYYYYKNGETPKSLKDVKVFTIFPNTQTTWNNYGDGGQFYASPRGVTEGTSVQLKFFGENYELKEGTSFPQGYRIGFVLACNAWDYKFAGFNTQTDNYISCSTANLSSKGANGIDVHTAMFKDQKGNIAICFEDFKDDENFTDVLFALKANPVITEDLPDVDLNLNTTIEKKGVYAFEDEWPKAGDYDMNDVLVQYTYQKTFNTHNNILSEAFTFKTFFNKHTVFTNGLGFTLTNAGNNPTTEYLIKKEGENEFSPASGTDKIISEGNVIILTDNVKTNQNAEYKVTCKYGKDSSSKQLETTIDAFIYRPSKGNTRSEIHCPMRKPTSKADISLFGQYDDRSMPEKGIYYISDKNNIYPFAFYLSNADIKDIDELKNFDANEKKSISELYPGFIDWAQYGKNPDWYKKK